MKKRTPAPPKPKPKAEKPFFRPFASVAKKVAEEKASQPETKPKGAPKPAAVKHPPAMGEREPTFAEMVWGVQRTDRGPRAEPSFDKTAPTTAAAKLAEEAEAASVREHLRKLVEGGDARFEVSDDGARIEGRRIDVDAKVVRRLRRGEMSIDVQCDLHGLGVHEARARTEDIVQSSRAKGERVLLLIHGKGRHSHGGRPILRGEVAAWLSQDAASVHVAAFVTALPDDGGEGAMYVLLRQR
jgi:DNA-nicking Smr family endonuclease